MSLDHLGGEEREKDLTSQAFLYHAAEAERGKVESEEPEAEEGWFELTSIDELKVRLEELNLLPPTSLVLRLFEATLPAPALKLLSLLLPPLPLFCCFPDCIMRAPQVQHSVGPVVVWDSMESLAVLLRLLLLLLWPALELPPTGSLTDMEAAAMAACSEVVVPRSTTSPMGPWSLPGVMLVTLELEQLVRMLQLEPPARWPLELPLASPLLPPPLSPLLP